jgi:hypothetical protein
VGHFLAQTEAEFFTAALKIIGGGAVTALLFGALWAVLTGKGIVPRWVYDGKCKECEAEHFARIAAEARLDQALAALNKTGRIAENIVERTPQHQPAESRQEGSPP